LDRLERASPVNPWEPLRQRVGSALRRLNDLAIRRDDPATPPDDLARLHEQIGQVHEELVAIGKEADALNERMGRVGPWTTARDRTDTEGKTT
jgi:hypothetical protein